MTEKQFKDNSIVWWSWVFLWLILEGLGFSRKTPWAPLTEYVWAIEDRNHLAQYGFLVLFAALLVHFVGRWTGHND